MNKYVLLLILLCVFYTTAYSQDEDIKLILHDAKSFVKDGYYENGLSQLNYYQELTNHKTTPEIEIIYIDAWIALENYLEAQRHIDLFLKVANTSNENYKKVTAIATGISSEIVTLEKELKVWARNATKNGEPYQWEKHNGLMPVGFSPYFKWCGYIDKEGHVKTPFIYRVASHFENGVAYVDNKVSGYKELIDQNINTVARLASNIVSVYPFQNGYAGVKLKELDYNKQPTYGFINEQGKRIDNNGFGLTEVYLFSDGSRYPILKDDKFGTVSISTGKVTIDEEKYTIFSTYHNGYILVRPKNWAIYEAINNDYRESSKMAIEIMKNQGQNTLSGYAMLDKNGNEYIPMDDTYLYLEPFYNGYSIAGKKGKGFGVINEQLEEVLPFQYNQIGRAANPNEFVILDEGTLFGKARVYNAALDKMLSESVITTSKRSAFPEATITYPSFNAKLMPLVTKKGKVRYYDHDLNDVFEKDFAFAKDFSEGMASIMNKDGQVGYINETGEIVVDYQYSVGQLFQQNLAAVSQGAIGSEKYGYINKQGEVIIPMKYDHAEPFFDATEIFKYYYSPKQLNLIAGWDVSVTHFDITFNTNEVFFHLLEGKKLALVKYKDKLQFIDQTGKVWVERLWNDQEIRGE